MSGFCVHYDSDNEERVVEWNWFYRGEWSRGACEFYADKWVSKRGLDDDAYDTILKKFGLFDYWYKFSLYRKTVQELTTMSPAKLIAERRFLEGAFGLPHLEVFNERRKYREHKAEEYS